MNTTSEPKSGRQSSRKSLVQSPAPDSNKPEKNKSKKRRVFTSDVQTVAIAKIIIKRNKLTSNSVRQSRQEMQERIDKAIKEQQNK